MSTTAFCDMVLALKMYIALLEDPRTRPEDNELELFANNLLEPIRAYERLALHQKSPTSSHQIVHLP